MVVDDEVVVELEELDEPLTELELDELLIELELDELVEEEVVEELVEVELVELELMLVDVLLLVEVDDDEVVVELLVVEELVEVVLDELELILVDVLIVVELDELELTLVDELLLVDVDEDDVLVELLDEPPSKSSLSPVSSNNLDADVPSANNSSPDSDVNNSEDSVIRLSESRRR